MARVMRLAVSVRIDGQIKYVADNILSAGLIFPVFIQTHWAPFRLVLHRWQRAYVTTCM